MIYSYENFHSKIPVVIKFEEWTENKIWAEVANELIPIFKCQKQF